MTEISERSRAEVEAVLQGRSRRGAAVSLVPEAALVPAVGVLLIGGMDLSLEGTYGLAPMVAAWLMVPTLVNGSGAMLSPYLAIVVLLARGAGVGLVNGLLIVKGRLNGFIVTLGMMIVLAGLLQGIVKGNSLFNLPAA